jgi:hypothetical protein
LHGVKPEKGNGPAVKTMVNPLNPDDPDMDPLEQMLNPELCVIDVKYVYFMPYDYVTYGFDFHVGDLE